MMNFFQTFLPNYKRSLPYILRIAVYTAYSRMTVHRRIYCV